MMRSVIVQEIDKVEKLVYFVRKIFKDVVMRYKKFEKLTLVVFTAARKL